MELTPREAPVRAPATRRKGWLVYAAMGVILIVLGFVVVKGLSNATVFFYNADEAVAKRDDMGERRFRLQGAVVPGSIHSEGHEVDFMVTYGGVDVPVVHIGDPPELFQEDIPVVLEGRWSEADPATFASDRILVKHSNEYVEDNPDRVEEYDEAPDDQGRSTGPADSP